MQPFHPEARNALEEDHPEPKCPPSRERHVDVTSDDKSATATCSTCKFSKTYKLAELRKRYPNE